MKQWHQLLWHFCIYLHILRAACSLTGLHVGLFQTEIIHYCAFLSELRDTSTARLYFSVLRAMFYSCLKRFQHKMCVDMAVICTWFHSNTQWVSRLDDCTLAKLMLLRISFWGAITEQNSCLIIYLLLEAIKGDVWNVENNIRLYYKNCTLR